METWLAHGFDAQPVQRYETLLLVLLSGTVHFIVSFSLYSTLGKAQCSC